MTDEQHRTSLADLQREKRQLQVEYANLEKRMAIVEAGIRSHRAALGDKPIMFVNGTPIYRQPLPTEILTEEQVEEMAFKLTGSRETAQAWMDRPNVTLRGRTPREVTRAGEGQRAAGIIRSF